MGNRYTNSYMENEQLGFNADYEINKFLNNASSLSFSKAIETYLQLHFGKKEVFFWEVIHEAQKLYYQKFRLIPISSVHWQLL